MYLVGHRGSKDEWPENTLLGIEKAIENGVLGIEIDVHKTIDNHLVVIHDPTVDRTTNGTGKVSQMELRELKTLDAGQGQSIPTLDEVLRLTMKHKVRLFIESKVYDIAPELVGTIQQHDAFTSCTVICFNHFLVKEVKELDSRISTGCLLVGAPVDAVKIVQGARANLLAINIFTADPRLVKQCQTHGVQVGVWNGNTPEDVKTMKSLGVDFVMTDRPSSIVPIA